ncbi:MAG: tetratricopeptide repeat protein [Gemmatimonadaceae bacterium]
MKRIPFSSMLLVAATFVATASAAAMYWSQDVAQVPLARLSRNLRAAISREPNNVEFIVNLARVHAMSWSMRSDSVPALVSDRIYYLRMPGDTLPTAHPIEPMSVWFGHDVGYVPFSQIPPSKNPTSKETAHAHLDTAIVLYQSALKLDPTNTIARLGYAWLLSNTNNKKLAITELRAVTSAKSPPTQDGLGIHAEAAGYLIPLLDSVKDRREIARLRDTIETEHMRMRTVTPIAIPLRDGMTAGNVESSGARVKFDADGSGLQRNWTWITRNAAWLVYDPKHSGHITSSLQLFGNVTFWMFWANGYNALSSLDDNHDGKLTAHELEGLALWRDANANGISDPGEVQSISKYGIIALSCVSERDNSHPDRIAFSRGGVTFRNGKTRSTFDIVLHAQPAAIVANRQ